MGGNWRDLAACANADPDSFFPTAGGRIQVRNARMICQSCPVINACLAFAVDNEIPYGIWGGLMPAERGIGTSGDKYGRGDNNRTLKGCGTTAGYTYHIRHGTVPCPPCALAETTRNQIYKKARKARLAEAREKSA